MAATEVNGVDHLLQAVASGSVDDIKIIFYQKGLEESIKLSQSYNLMGETPLLVAIKKKRYDVMKYLVKVLNVDIAQVGHFASNGVDYADCPPLFAAVVSDQLSVVVYLTTTAIASGKLLLHLDSFLSSSSVSYQKINVLELMGAIYLLSEDRKLRLHGLSYWKEAMALKSFTSAPPRIPRDFSVRGFRFVDATLEAMTLEQLELIVKDDSLFNQQLVKEQALYVSQRVLSQMQLFPNIFIISHFIQNARTLFIFRHKFQYTSREQIQHLCNAVLYPLELLKVWLEMENPSSCSTMQILLSTNQAISQSYHLFLTLRTITPDVLLPFDNFMFALDFVCQHLHRFYTKFWPVNVISRSISIGPLTTAMYHISVAIFLRLPQFSRLERQQFKQCLSHYIRLHQESEKDRPTLLHEACCIIYFNKQEANYEKVVQLFLEAGEDPNATDSQGNTPLHCLLAKNEFEYCLLNPWDNSNGSEHTSIVSLNYVAVIRLLLDSGCHVDQPNEEGVTILELLKRNRKMQKNFKKPFDPYLELVINAVLPLTCYSAQFIRKRNISTEKLPSALQLFVRRH